MNKARGYTGSGYKRRARRPYGCAAVTGCGCGCGDTRGEEGTDDSVVVLFRGEVMDSRRSCTAERISGRGKEV